MKRPLKPGVFGAAQFETFDGVRVGRLRLDRWWEPDLHLDECFGHPDDDRYRPLVVIGMNPSDADGEHDDPTIGKCMTFARREGANGLVMINVHPGISTDPDELANILLPYGCDERQREALDGAMCEDVVAVVAAWGKPPRRLSSWRDRVRTVLDVARDVGRELLCFGTNGDGSPKHPLYLAAKTPLVPWRSSR